MNDEQLNTSELEHPNYGSNCAENILKVALRHGLNENLADEFLSFIEEELQEHVDYHIWVNEMGDDL